jgi:SAM-dependent methyltransferase
MAIPKWAPTDVPLDRPSAARMYDYYLGGFHNFEIDRQMAEQAIALWSDLPLIMRANRAFLRRSVNYLVGKGIDQFLDIGSGIPTVGNVHEIAQQANAAAHVVYVDIDPIAVAHSRAILQGTSNVAAIQADIREPLQILTDQQVRKLLNLDRPIALFVVAVLHFIPDDAQASNAIREFRDAVAPGSFLVISHATFEGMPARSREHEELYARTPNPLKMRSRIDIQNFFGDFELVEPGLDYIPLWRPEGADDLFVEEPERCSGYAGVGRKSPRL